MFVYEANHIYIAMPVYSLIEYCDSYSDTPGSLKKDEIPSNNADLTIVNFGSFKYKAALAGKTKKIADQKSYLKDRKIFVPLKYLSNFWRSLEIPIINCNVHLELNWTEGCIL